MKIPQSVKLPYCLYQDLLNYLASHEATDEWSASLLEHLQEEAKPVHEFASERQVFEGSEAGTYRVN